MCARDVDRYKYHQSKVKCLVAEWEQWMIKCGNEGTMKLETDSLLMNYLQYGS